MLETTIPVRPEDEEFLFQLYASTRAQELLAWGWDEAMQQEFLKMQWKAQQMSYSTSYPNANHRLILAAQQRAGRIILFQNDLEIRLVDISLLPEYHNRGIGRTLLSDLQQEAAKAGLPLRLRVLKTNPALRLYERMHFTSVHDDGLSLTMQWSADGATNHF